ncbi:MAG: hypothetical protein JWP10_365, partial [Nocardioidaceae bacterium]|nr:hypothetical protein [Nocardioidaceae bacterium]
MKAVAQRLLAVIVTIAVAVGTVSLLAPSDAQAADAGFSVTKTVTRVNADPAGADGPGRTVVDSRNVTVKVDNTTNLRGRERVKITWSGARPSAARASNPYGENGLNQEYPVVIMQCRGTDDQSLPAAKRLSPETCWTSTRQQRSQSVGSRLAIWRHDLFASDAAKGQLSGADP